MEVLSPEKRRRALTLAQFHLFYFSGYSTSKMHFGSTVPGKNDLEVLFPEKTRVQKSPRLASLKVKRILEVLFPEKRALSAGEHSCWPNFTFFYFYFSGDSTSILLFFRSTESPGKTRSVFTPPWRKSIQVKGI